MNTYIDIANSNTLFFIVFIPLLIVAVQSVIFLRIGIARAKELGIGSEMIKKVMTNSAVFSILPSMPIVIVMATMIPILGKFLPWLRLSVIGSAMYESMAADITIKAFGFTGLGDTNITGSVFVGMVWVMSLAILVGPLLNIFLLKSYDKQMKKVQNTGGFLASAIPALFIGFMAVTGMPRLVNFEDPVGIIVVVVSSISVVGLDVIAKKSNIKVLSEFSFPLSMLIGMGSALIFAGLF